MTRSGFFARLAALFGGFGVLSGARGLGNPGRPEPTTLPWPEDPPAEGGYDFDEHGDLKPEWADLDDMEDGYTFDIVTWRPTPGEPHRPLFR